MDNTSAQFRSYATSQVAGFRVSLPSRQRFALLALARGTSAVFGVRTLRALAQKGLIYWTKDERGVRRSAQVTRAGELLIGLLGEAGLDSGGVAVRPGPSRNVRQVRPCISSVSA